MKNYEEVVKIYKGLVGNDCGREEAVAEIDNSISFSGMWGFAKSVGALDEENSCEDFAIAHMSAYNKIFGCKY